MKSQNRGALEALAAYVLWGVFPIYFRALQAVPPFQILLHRMIWSLVFIALVLGVRRQWAWFGQARRNPLLLARFAASAGFLSLNWFVYIWACNADRIVDASLGYFINPLVNVLLGFLVLRERLRRAQWLAIGVAALAVAWLTVQAGHLPWIGLTLALSFGLYGVLRKTAPLGALEGLAVETLVFFPVAAASIAFLSWHNANAFAHADAWTRTLLLVAGPITAVPLLLFADAARRISFSLLGLLQYSSPTIQLVIGVWLYGESFGGARALGYAGIWLALILYSAESLWQAHRRSRPAPALSGGTVASEAGG